ncbi:MAG: hypothetical protein ISR44_04600 [Rhodospirillales bacterium]|nr:hypothetical protein [Rhodospirillales bacterium]
MAAAESLASRKKVVVLGSGLLYDVPLAELAELFEDVVLIDIFHMPAVRRTGAKYTNVRLLAHDLTGGDLPENDADLVVSANLLTQLPFIPRRFADESEGFAQAIMAHHLEQLSSVRATTCLISEVEHLVCAGNQVIERIDPLYGISLGEPDREWFWDIAPHPELHRQYDTRYRVIAKIG